MRGIPDGAARAQGDRELTLSFAANVETDGVRRTRAVPRILRRLVRWAAILLVSAAVLYLVGVNLFLRTRLFRDVVGGDPRSLVVEYGSAYSLWPGKVHADDLVIRGSDTHVEWILVLEHCDFRVSLTDLAHSKLRADHVRGDGVSFRLRRRVDVLTPEMMSALPPIAGFLDPPLADAGPPDPPLTDATYDLWSFDLEDIVARHVHEVWVDTTRYSGDLEIHGRWVLRPLRWLDVGPATIDARPLDVSFGNVEPWASGMVGTGEVTVHPFSLATVPSESIPQQLSVHSSLAGIAYVANIVNRAAEGSGMSIHPAEAATQLRIDIEHGHLRPGTHVRTEPFEVMGDFAGITGAGAIKLDARVDEDGVGYADIRVAPARLSASGEPCAQVDALAATVVSRDLDVSEALFSSSAYAVEVDRAQTDSPAYWLSRLRPAHGSLSLTGTLTASGRLEGALRQKTGRGHVVFAAHDVALATARTRVHGNARGVL
ncbi:MAG TPA: hypothetical protein VHS09_10100, partial [Polyangiaceae bacterium]|nr:hypothetical protein [Polyangiaceae bacterium]